VRLDLITVLWGDGPAVDVCAFHRRLFSRALARDRPDRLALDRHGFGPKRLGIGLCADGVCEDGPE
jgi:hypothetical protein